MQCPVCNQEVMPKWKFFFLSNPKKNRCRSCNAILKPDKLMKKWQKIEGYLAGGLGVVCGVIFSDQLLEGSIPHLLGLLILSGLIVFPFDLLSWKQGRYLPFDENVDG